MSKADQPLSILSSLASSIVPSPCTDICQLNTDDICIGCHRSIDEITGWNALSNDKKRAILVKVDARKSI